MTKPPVYIGADPGAGGALARFSPVLYDLGLDEALEVTDAPTHEINGKRRLDMHALIRLLRGWRADWDVRLVVIENVSAMPGQSPNGMFQFGFACGALQMAAVALDLPMRLVTPQVWKKRYQLLGGRENKDMSRLKACQLFPLHAHFFARKKDDGRAEAALVAKYGSEQ